mgnify:CR=1 FL=1
MGSNTYTECDSWSNSYIYDIRSLGGFKRLVSVVEEIPSAKNFGVGEIEAG